MPTALHVAAVALDAALGASVLAWYWRQYFTGGQFHRPPFIEESTNDD